MAIYKLEQDPTIFITPTYYGDKFVYRMAYILASNNRTLIRNIDLRKDKLRVHGTEIKESELQILHDSLTIGQKQGHIYVNCKGACYFFIIGKGYCRPIHNAVFDWSRFGVVVPDSIHNSLRKELKDKDSMIDNLNQRLLSTEASLKKAQTEVTRLNEEVLTQVKTRKYKELELKNVSDKLSLVDFEFESSKIESESTKQAVLDQLSSCKDECQCMKTELETVRHQLSSTNSELGLSKEKVVVLENDLSTCNKGNEEKKTELRNMKDELSSIKFELESSKNNVKELEDQLESTKMLLECSKKEIQELNNQACPCKEGHYDMGNKIRELSNDLDSINSEVRSSNQKIEQVLISMLWNELVLGNQILPRLLSMRCSLSSDEDHDEDENESHVISSATSNLAVLIKIEEIDEDT